MGHTEMLLAVAGLDEKAIEERTRKLASGRLGALPAGRAGRLRLRPQAGDRYRASVDCRGRARLWSQHFGPDRALDVVWWTCRCHYMTCVSDAFQLPLERENVFDGFLPRSDAGGRGTEPRR